MSAETRDREVLIARLERNLDQALGRLGVAEQELAAANAELATVQSAVARLMDLLDAVLTLQPADPYTGDRSVSLLALVEALEGES